MTKKNKPPRSIKRMFPQVETIIDAKKPITVHVAEKDCKSSEPLNPRECAMAKAAKREFKVDAAIIGISSSYLIKGKKAIRFDTPVAVQREIVSFDRHSDFDPGEYTLVPKSPTNRLGANREYMRKYNKDKSHGKKASDSHSPKRKVHKTAKIRDFGGW